MFTNRRNVTPLYYDYYYYNYYAVFSHLTLAAAVHNSLALKCKFDYRARPGKRRGSKLKITYINKKNVFAHTIYNRLRNDMYDTPARPNSW